MMKGVPKMDDPSKVHLTFEEAMKALEETVRRLESGELPLSDSIEQYKRSMELVQFCRQQLDKAELEIRQLTESNQLIAVETEQGD